MPSNRKLKADDVDGFMLSFWDSWVDLEEGYGVRLDLSIERGTQRGRTAFRAIARYDYEDRPDWVVARAECLWPGHYATTVHALLYSLLIRLWKDLDVWRAEEEMKASPPTVD